MTELFTILIKLAFISAAVSCGTPDEIKDDTGTIDNPLAYACVITTDGTRYIATGQIYEEPAEEEPEIELSGDAL